MAILSSDGALYTMGEGVFGALGHGDDLCRATPTRVCAFSGTHVVSRVACGVWHTAALARSNQAGSSVELFTWGQGDRGQLGNGLKGSSALTPFRIDVAQQQTQPDLTQVACGVAHTAVLTSAGAVLVSGKDSSGPSCVTFRRVLGPLADVHIDQIACGDKHTCVLSSAARVVYTWGTGAGGRLGHGGERDETVPRAVDIIRGRRVRYIVCGPECTLAVCLPQQWTLEEKAALAKAQDNAGWVVDATGVANASDGVAASASDSMSEVGRALALKAAKAWKQYATTNRIISLQQDGRADMEHHRHHAVDPVVAALRRELESAREDASQLRAQLATTEERAAKAYTNGHAPERAHRDASTMTDPARHVQFHEQPPLAVQQSPPAVPTARPALPGAAQPQVASPHEEVITVDPGVHIIAIGRVVRRVRFDRRVFSNEQAVEWWEQRRDQILGQNGLTMPGMS